MGKTIIVAIIAWVVGAALGILLARATIAHFHRRVRALRRQLRGEGKKMGTMDKVLVLEAVILVVYTVAALVVFWHTGNEPATLTACVFGVCGLENGVMGWIKTNKDKTAEASKTSGSGAAAPVEPPTEREEPQDVGL